MGLICIIYSCSCPQPFVTRWLEVSLICSGEVFPLYLNMFQGLASGELASGLGSSVLTERPLSSPLSPCYLPSFGRWVWAKEGPGKCGHHWLGKSEDESPGENQGNRIFNVIVTSTHICIALEDDQHWDMLCRLLETTQHLYLFLSGLWVEILFNSLALKAAVRNHFQQQLYF